MDAESGTAVRPPARRLWPPDPFLLIAGAVVAGGIILLVAGVWAWGVVALLGAAVVFLATRTDERRTAKYALAGIGARFSARRDTFRARSRGQIELFRARRERAGLEAERTRALQRLGQAVFYEEGEAVQHARQAVQDIVDAIGAKDGEIGGLIEQTEEQVLRAQAGVRPTQKLKAPPADEDLT